ncbi:alpha/beta fold hydrolase [Hymenobacter sp. B1770]|uniref:alpha/beta fold hydrolase n=1 Tax=Hymenobacter sp. B1770 TaxID=1718788 RepID=UPI003CE7558C
MGVYQKALRETDLRANLRQITLPTLILHGRLDKICSYKLAEQMHALSIEALEKFNAELLGFITKAS